MRNIAKRVIFLLRHITILWPPDLYCLASVHVLVVVCWFVHLLGRQFAPADGSQFKADSIKAPKQRKIKDYPT